MDTDIPVVVEIEATDGPHEFQIKEKDDESLIVSPHKSEKDRSDLPPTPPTEQDEPISALEGAITPSIEILTAETLDEVRPTTPILTEIETQDIGNLSTPPHTAIELSASHSEDTAILSTEENEPGVETKLDETTEEGHSGHEILEPNLDNTHDPKPEGAIAEGDIALVDADTRIASIEQNDSAPEIKFVTAESPAAATAPVMAEEVSIPTHEEVAEAERKESRLPQTSEFISEETENTLQNFPASSEDVPSNPDMTPANFEGEPIADSQVSAVEANAAVSDKSHEDILKNESATPIIVDKEDKTLVQDQETLVIDVAAPEAAGLQTTEGHVDGLAEPPQNLADILQVPSVKEAPGTEVTIAASEEGEPATLETVPAVDVPAEAVLPAEDLEDTNAIQPEAAKQEVEVQQEPTLDRATTPVAVLEGEVTEGTLVATADTEENKNEPDTTDIQVEAKEGVEETSAPASIEGTFDKRVEGAPVTEAPTEELALQGASEYDADEGKVVEESPAETEEVLKEETPAESRLETETTDGQEIKTSTIEDQRSEAEIGAPTAVYQPEGEEELSKQQVASELADELPATVEDSQVGELSEKEDLSEALVTELPQASGESEKQEDDQNMPQTAQLEALETSEPPDIVEEELEIMALHTAAVHDEDSTGPEPTAASAGVESLHEELVVDNSKEQEENFVSGVPVPASEEALHTSPGTGVIADGTAVCEPAQGEEKPGEPTPLADTVENTPLQGETVSSEPAPEDTAAPAPGEAPQTNEIIPDKTMDFVRESGDTNSEEANLAIFLENHPRHEHIVLDDVKELEVSEEQIGEDTSAPVPVEVLVEVLEIPEASRNGEVVSDMQDPEQEESSNPEETAPSAGNVENPSSHEGTFLEEAVQEGPVAQEVAITDSLENEILLNEKANIGPAEGDSKAAEDAAEYEAPSARSEVAENSTLSGKTVQEVLAEDDAVSGEPENVSQEPEALPAEILDELSPVVEEHLLTEAVVSESTDSAGHRVVDVLEETRPAAIENEVEEEHQEEIESGATEGETAENPVIEPQIVSDETETPLVDNEKPDTQIQQMHVFEATTSEAENASAVPEAEIPVPEISEEPTPSSREEHADNLYGTPVAKGPNKEIPNTEPTVERDDIYLQGTATIDKSILDIAAEESAEELNNSQAATGDLETSAITRDSDAPEAPNIEPSVELDQSPSQTSALEEPEAVTNISEFPAEASTETSLVTETSPAETTELEQELVTNIETQESAEQTSGHSGAQDEQALEEHAAPVIDAEKVSEDNLMITSEVLKSEVSTLESLVEEASPEAIEAEEEQMTGEAIAETLVASEFLDTSSEGPLATNVEEIISLEDTQENTPQAPPEEAPTGWVLKEGVDQQEPVPEQAGGLVHSEGDAEAFQELPEFAEGAKGDTVESLVEASEAPENPPDEQIPAITPNPTEAFTGKIPEECQAATGGFANETGAVIPKDVEQRGTTGPAEPAMPSIEELLETSADAPQKDPVELVQETTVVEDSTEEESKKTVSAPVLELIAEESITPSLEAEASGILPEAATKVRQQGVLSEVAGSGQASEFLEDEAVREPTSTTNESANEILEAVSLEAAEEPNEETLVANVQNQSEDAVTVAVAETTELQAADILLTDLTNEEVVESEHGQVQEAIEDTQLEPAEGTPTMSSEGVAEDSVKEPLLPEQTSEVAESTPVGEFNDNEVVPGAAESIVEPHSPEPEAQETICSGEMENPNDDHQTFENPAELAPATVFDESEIASLQVTEKEIPTIAEEACKLADEESTVMAADQELVVEVSAPKGQITTGEETVKGPAVEQVKQAVAQGSTEAESEVLVGVIPEELGVLTTGETTELTVESFPEAPENVAAVEEAEVSGVVEQPEELAPTASDTESHNVPNDFTVEATSIPAFADAVRQLETPEETPTEPIVGTSIAEITDTVNKDSDNSSKLVHRQTPLEHAPSQIEEEIPVHALIVERTEENQPMFGEIITPESTEGGISAFEKGQADAAPDQVVAASGSSLIEQHVLEEDVEQEPDVPRIVVELTPGNQPSHGDDPGPEGTVGQKDAFEARQADAVPDHVTINNKDEPSDEAIEPGEDEELVVINYEDAIPEEGESVVMNQPFTDGAEDSEENLPTNQQDDSGNPVSILEMTKTVAEVAGVAAILDAPGQEEPAEELRQLTDIPNEIPEAVTILHEDKEQELQAPSEGAETENTESAPTPLPEIVETSIEVADTAALVDASEKEQLMREEPATPLPEIVATSDFMESPDEQPLVEEAFTPLPEIVETAVQVADTAAILDVGQEILSVERVPETAVTAAGIAGESPKLAETVDGMDHSEPDAQRQEAPVEPYGVPEIFVVAGAGAIAAAAATATVATLVSQTQDDESQAEFPESIPVPEGKHEASESLKPTEPGTPMPRVARSTSEAAYIAATLEFADHELNTSLHKTDEKLVASAEGADDKSDNIPLSSDVSIGEPTKASTPLTQLVETTMEVADTAAAIGVPTKEREVLENYVKTLESPELEPTPEFVPAHAKVGSIDVGYGTLLEPLQHPKSSGLADVEEQTELKSPTPEPANLHIPGGFDDATSEAVPADVEQIPATGLLGQEPRKDIDRALKDQVTENPELHQDELSSQEPIPEPGPDHSHGKGAEEPEAVKVTENIFEAQDALLAPRTLTNAPSEYTTSLISIDAISEALRYMRENSSTPMLSAPGSVPAIVVSSEVEDEHEDNGLKPRQVVEVITPTPEESTSGVRQRKATDSKLEPSRPSTRGSDRLSTKHHRNLLQNFWHMVFVGWLGGFGRFFVGLFGRKNGVVVQLAESGSRVNLINNQQKQPHDEKGKGKEKEGESGTKKQSLGRTFNTKLKERKNSLKEKMKGK